VVKLARCVEIENMAPMLTRADYLHLLERTNQNISRVEGCISQQSALVERLPIDSKSRVAAKEVLLLFSELLSFLYEHRESLLRELGILSK